MTCARLSMNWSTSRALGLRQRTLWYANGRMSRLSRDSAAATRIIITNEWLSLALSSCVARFDRTCIIRTCVRRGDRVQSINLLNFFFSFNSTKIIICLRIGKVIFLVRSLRGKFDRRTVYLFVGGRVDFLEIRVDARF